MPIYILNRNQSFSQINTTAPIIGGGPLTASALTIGMGTTGSSGTYDRVTVNDQGLVTSGLGRADVSSSFIINTTAPMAGGGPLTGSQITISMTGTYVQTAFTVQAVAPLLGSGPLTGSTLVLSLASTGSAGTYDRVTVNQFGQVTAGSGRNDVSASFTVNTTAPLLGGGPLTGSQLTVSLSTTGSAGSYNTVTVNQFGQVTSGSNVGASSGVYVTASFIINTTSPIQGGGPLTGSQLTLNLNSAALVSSSFNVQTVAPIQGGGILTGSTIILSLASTGSAATYDRVTVNQFGQVTSGLGRTDVSASFIFQTSGSIVGGGPMTGSSMLILLTGSIDMKRSDLQNIQVPWYFKEIDNGTAGASKTIDWTLSARQSVTVSTNLTASFTAPPGVTNLILKVRMMGPFRIAWPAGTKWVNSGTLPPTETTNSGSVHLMQFYYDTANYHGSYGLNSV